MTWLFWSFFVPVVIGLFALALGAYWLAGRALRQDDAFTPRRRYELDKVVTFTGRRFL